MPANPTQVHAAASGAVPGLDLPRLRGWLGEAIPSGSWEGLSATLVAGGKSNLTYFITDGTQQWVLRRPPLGRVPDSAHDMNREYRVMSALRGTPVPVPRTFALCTDQAVLGAPFYVMERVLGTPYRHSRELARLGAARTRTVAQGMVDVLAALHRVDAAAVGLADFGKPERFLARQVNRWKRQLDSAHPRDLPAAGDLHTRLLASLPERSAATIVHGDYRLDNVLIDDEDRPAAIIDWEMATLGDPLTDVALLLLYARLSRVPQGKVIADAMAAPGFLSETEMLGRYADASRVQLDDLGFHLGLAAFKLAVVLEGIHSRFLRGETVGPGFDQLGDLVPSLLEWGHAYLKEQYR